jgi:hypothetical protein
MRYDVAVSTLAPSCEHVDLPWTRWVLYDVDESILVSPGCVPNQKKLWASWGAVLTALKAGELRALGSGKQV